MKYVIVTGGTGGMGKAVCDNLIKQGYGVFALDRKTVQTDNPNLYSIETDVTDMKSILCAYEKIKSVTDEIHAICHFAGIYVMDSLIEISEEQFINAFNVNLFGCYRINKTFIPLLKEGSKIVIATSELAPLDPLPFTGLYAITKSALDKYAYSLRMEVQLLNVQVCVIRPGAVKTNMLGDSTYALDNFCENTKLYSCNAKAFKKIVNKVEARNIPPEKIAKLTAKILNKKKAKQLYKINANPLLLLLNLLPCSLQTKIIKTILKT